MSLSPPAAKRPKLSSEEKQISDLSDADLAAVFEHLPPYERLIASEVCRRWQALSRKAWLDITLLDLSLIPGKHITAILRQCPNLRSVFALKKSFGLSELASLAKLSKLWSVKLYDCSFAYQSVSGPYMDIFNVDFEEVFSENLHRAPWHELVLHNAVLDDKAVAGDRVSFSQGLSLACLPAAVNRLQLTGLRLRKGTRYFYHPLLFDLDYLGQNLECLILHDTPESGPSEDSVELLGRAWDYSYLIFTKINALTNLTELCLGPSHSLSQNVRLYSPILFARLMSSLPKLAVLFLCEADVEGLANEFAKLITGNGVLRILVLAGWPYRPVQAPGEPELQPIDLPARKRFPHGFGSAPLPLLHVFVGKSESEHLRFAQSASDAALIHHIDAPMPQFLEREDIAPIFEGCWIAEKIKEMARNGGGRLWDYEGDACASSAPHV